MTGHGGGAACEKKGAEVGGFHFASLFSFLLSLLLVPLTFVVIPTCKRG